MKEFTTSAAVVPVAIVEEAWQEVGASFERFCPTAGIATLATMMEDDAARLCGPRYGRAEGMPAVLVLTPSIGWPHRAGDGA
jgi:hypothetical protein